MIFISFFFVKIIFSKTKILYFSGEVGVNMPHPGIGPTSDPNLIEKLPNGGKQNNTCFSTIKFVKS